MRAADGERLYAQGTKDTEPLPADSHHHGGRGGRWQDTPERLEDMRSGNCTDQFTLGDDGGPPESVAQPDDLLLLPARHGGLLGALLRHLAASGHFLTLVSSPAADVGPGASPKVVLASCWWTTPVSSLNCPRSGESCPDRVVWTTRELHALPWIW